MRLLKLIILGLIAFNLVGCGGMMVYEYLDDDEYVEVHRVRPVVVVQRRSRPDVTATKNPSIRVKHRCRNCSRY